MMLPTLMVQINYAFISLCAYISFLSAYTFRVLFINLNYMDGFGYILSLSLLSSLSPLSGKT